VGVNAGERFGSVAKEGKSAEGPTFCLHAAQANPAKGSHPGRLGLDEGCATRRLQATAGPSPDRSRLCLGCLVTPERVAVYLLKGETFS
jgi:hypothetical protein